ncbi:MAG: hypothetical protein QOG49_1198 [Frankiaceae bacterium]|nr:hypothetical protein [Frankiaceae bacterium]
MPADPAPRLPFLTPGASPLRHAVERRSATVLLFLRSLPKALPPLAVVGLLAGGFLAHGVAAALCLVAVMVLFGWLLYISWPALPSQARVVRLAVMVMLAAGVVMSATR